MNSSKERNRGVSPQAWQSKIDLESMRLANRTQKEQLREERLLNAAILAASNELILFCDHKGRILRHSHACEQMMSHRWEELKGSYIWDSLLCPGDIERAKAFFDRAKSNKGALILKDQYETDWLDPAGDIRYISWTITLFWDDSGETSYAICVGTDVTGQHMMEQTLQENKASLRSILHNANGIIYTLSPDGRFLFISRGWTDALGQEISEVRGQSFERLIHPDDIPVCRDFLNVAMTTGKTHKPVEYRVKHIDGSWRWHSSSGSAVTDKAGNPEYYVGLAVDITEQKSAVAAHRLSEERFSKAFNASPATMSISVMEDSRYIDVNDSFCRVSGYKREEILGKPSLELGFWVDTNQRQQVVNSLLNKQPVRDMEIVFRRKSGEKRQGSYSAEMLDIDGQKCLLSIVTDITERKQTEAEIRYLSFYDKLTGLYNRAYFEEELKRLDTARELPLSIIMGDVNGLKLVNDALGHLHGDSLLVTAAETLKRFCRHEDVVARWGGDEFIVLLPGCDYDAAHKVYNRVKKACKRVDTVPFQTSMSLGLACKSHPEQDIHEVIKEAEDKMYRNKLLETRSARSRFIMSLEKTLWTRSHETREHCERMQKTAEKIGHAVGLPDSEMDNLLLLAALHDIGKIAIPNSILEKTGQLTAEEWEAIKKHPEIGYRIGLSSPEMAPIAEAILHHHERWDGKGYPLGIKGSNIPLLSRIVAIADTYDVMVYGRPYQTPASQFEVKRELEKCAGSQFDPDLVRVALDILGLDQQALN
ncbi:MAG: PAS domain S-box protein [Syntrophomonadaceae bacterium]|nr:PAS domain S-box protein [Syntrophomonadaceae bacterium]